MDALPSNVQEQIAALISQHLSAGNATPPILTGSTSESSFATNVNSSLPLSLGHHLLPSHIPQLSTPSAPLSTLLPASQAATAPPVLQSYQPTQALVRPSQPGPSLLSSSQQPFLPISMARLGGNLNTSQVNQARLASSASSNNRLQQLPRRTSRISSHSVWGPFTHPPTLPVIRLDARLCYVEGAEEPTLRITSKIYPQM